MKGEELARLGDALREAETIGLEWSVDKSKPKANRAPKKHRTRIDPHAAAALRLLILTALACAKFSGSNGRKSTRAGRGLPSDEQDRQEDALFSAAALAVLSEIPRVEGSPYVIAGKGDARRADLKRPWASVTRAAKLDGLRIHDLRHSFASIGAGASMGLPIIGKLLGHSQPATTARYAHLDADPMRRAVDAIGATISAAMDRAPQGEAAPNVVSIGGRRA